MCVCRADALAGNRARGTDCRAVGASARATAHGCVVAPGIAWDGQHIRTGVAGRRSGWRGGRLGARREVARDEGRESAGVGGVEREKGCRWDVCVCVCVCV